MAAAELANQTAIDSNILAESLHKKHAFLSLLDGEGKSKATHILGFDFDVNPYLHLPKALVWLARLSARMSECVVCTSSAAATARAMTEGTCAFLQAGLTGRRSFAYFSVAYTDVGEGREQDAEALL